MCSVIICLQSAILFIHFLGDAMKNFIPGLAAAFITTIGANSAAQAAVHIIDFSVDISAAGGGALSFVPTGASTLDKSTSFDFDGTKLVVESVGADDNSSGLAAGDPISLAPSHIDYGTGMGGTGIMDAPIIKSWTAADGDVFTEKLTEVASINRGTTDDITVKLTGEVTDSFGIFDMTPASMTLGVTEDGGPGAAISVSMSNFAKTSPVPEPSTWVMMTLGFVGLGYAAVRRSSKNRSALAAV
jgi:PEP-CTERM motif